ncbi:hypothetical protein GOD41_08495 [Sinorhizobium medicae]|nr:hypothetical protein [Sinorhizobium medicae]
MRVPKMMGKAIHNPDKTARVDFTIYQPHRERCGVDDGLSNKPLTFQGFKLPPDGPPGHGACDQVYQRNAEP